jgi:hypothetical protein
MVIEGSSLFVASDSCDSVELHNAAVTFSAMLQGLQGGGISTSSSKATYNRLSIVVSSVVCKDYDK